MQFTIVYGVSEAFIPDRTTPAHTLCNSPLRPAILFVFVMLISEEEIWVHFRTLGHGIQD
jgi:hypothetical protein